MFIDHIDDNKYKICVQDGTDRVATCQVLRNEKGCRSKKLFQFKNSKCIVYSKFVLIFTLPKSLAFIQQNLLVFLKLFCVQRLDHLELSLSVKTSILT